MCCGDQVPRGHNSESDLHTSNNVNTLTPKPAITGHATSVLVGRISAGCSSERGEKAVG
ncbi:hypothetical protein AVEN_192133-1, partial [Araneus ventricosus]